jgi:hypothetical protein
MKRFSYDFYFHFVLKNLFDFKISFNSSAAEVLDC